MPVLETYGDITAIYRSSDRALPWEVRPVKTTDTLPNEHILRRVKLAVGIRFLIYIGSFCLSDADLRI